MRKHPLIARVRCAWCGRKFWTWEGYSKHVGKAHPKERW